MIKWKAKILGNSKSNKKRQIKIRQKTINRHNRINKLMLKMNKKEKKIRNLSEIVYINTIDHKKNILLKILIMKIICLMSRLIVNQAKS